MPDYAGALLRTALSRTLWLLVAPLAAGFVYHAWRAARGARARAVDGYVALVVVGLATGESLARVTRMFHGPAAGRAWIEHLAAGAQLGLLDGSFALLLDPMSATAAAFACAVAFGVTVWMAARAGTAAGARLWAWIELALAGALLTYLADNLVTLALGWTVAAAAAGWLAGWSDPDAAGPAITRSALALAALGLGGGWLFWGAGGRWDEGVYTRDHQPRFSALRSNDGAPGRSSIAMLDAPGALAYLDEARAPLATAPFSGVRLSAGPHVLRIRTGAADCVIDLEVPDSGASFVVVAEGPSLSFRDWALARRGALARDPGAEPAADPQAGAVEAALWAWVVAAWALSAMRPPEGAPVSFAALAYGATTAPLGPFLLARASVFGPMVRGMNLTLAAAGAAILLVSAEALWAAATRRRAARGAWWRELLEIGPRRAGALLDRFERWVLDAGSDAAIGALGVAGWIADRVDRGPTRRGGRR